MTPEKKTILFVSTSEWLPWGGSESLWVETARHLLSLGHGVCFSYKHWEPKPAALQRLEQEGARGYYRRWPPQENLWQRAWRRLRYERARAAEYPAFGTRHWLLTLVAETRPHLVFMNLHNAYEVADFYAPLEALHRQGIPFFLLSQLEGDEALLLEPKREALRFLYRSAVASAYGSRAGAELIQRQLAMELPKVIVFQNPPNSSRRRLPWPDTSGPCTMACVGRLDVLAKGQDRILAALSGPAWRSRNWRLSLYGQGPDEKYLKDLARHYGHADRVDFHGFVSDVDAIWAREQLCLQPSPKEGTPMTVVEAMFAARPSIVTNMGRMPDLIRDGETGWVVERSVESLERALDRAWDSRARWPPMGEAARRFIESYWNLDYPARFAEEILACL